MTIINIGQALYRNFLNKLFGFHLLILFNLVIINKGLSQSKISLKQAINLALDNNLQVRQALISEKDAQEALDQAKYNRLPSFNATSQGSSNSGRTLDITSYSYIDQHAFFANSAINGQMVLFQGGQLRNSIVENKIILDANKSNVNKIKNDLILNVVINYLQVLAAEDILSEAKQQVTIAETTLSNIKKLTDLGRKTISDISQASSRLASANVNVIDSQNKLEVAVLSLKQLMEMNPKIEVLLEKPNLSSYNEIYTDFDSETIYNEALKINPTVKLASLQKDAAEVNIKIAKGNYFPVISLFGSISSNFSSADKQINGFKNVIDTIGAVEGLDIPVIGSRLESSYNDYPFFKQYRDNIARTVGINIQIPVFNHFNARSMVRKAKDAYENQDLGFQIAKNDLVKIIDQAVLDLKVADKNYIASQMNLKALEQTYKIVKRRYDLGLSNTLDLETAEVNFDKATFDMIGARYTLIFRRKVIDYYLGKPIDL